MHTVPLRVWWNERFQSGVSHHARAAREFLQFVSPWTLLAPVIGIGLIAACMHTPARWLVAKATEELVAPSILACAFAVSLLFWIRSGQFHAMWLLLLSTALLCREFHFAGTDNGIYVAIVAIFWYASRRIDEVRPYWHSRLVPSLIAGAIWTYVVSKTFDRNYWHFIPGARAWNDPMEETLETVAHLFVLGGGLVSYRQYLIGNGTRWVRLGATAWPGRIAVTTLFLCGITLAYSQWESDPEPAVPNPSDFPFELSSLCNVNPAVGENLFLASSDEDRRLTLWTLNDQGRPVALQKLELAVPRDGAEPYHLDDLEDLSWDGHDTYFAIGSHRHLLPAEDSLRMQKFNGSECALISFELERSASGVAAVNVRNVTRELLVKIRELGVFPSVRWDSSKAFDWSQLSTAWQLNIEGLACVDGQLLVGFRDPVEHGCATILRYDPANDSLSVAAQPNLLGQGIMGLAYDRQRDALLVLSNDPTKSRYGDSCLWIGVPNSDRTGWMFPDKPHLILEHAHRGLRRKASGLTVHGQDVFVCFDSERDWAIERFPLDGLLR